LELTLALDLILGLDPLELDNELHLDLLLDMQFALLPMMLDIAISMPGMAFDM